MFQDLIKKFCSCAHLFAKLPQLGDREVTVSGLRVVGVGNGEQGRPWPPCMVQI